MTEKGKSKIKRRQFLDYLVAGSIGGAALLTLGGIVSFIYPPKKKGGAEKEERLDVGTLDELPVGKAKPVVFQGKNVMVMHVKAGFFAADMKCTHLGCMVEWQEKNQVLFCPCHAAVFDYQGKVISGPAPSPLPSYKVDIAGNKIVVTKA
jgi:cytochrome b6-f complex iron-sulfur subunit